MDLSELRKGERAEILSVVCPDALKERLSSLGIKEGGEICALKVSARKKTFLIATEESLIALSKEIAKCVTIRKSVNG